VTECHTEAIKFSPLRRRQVVADFNGGRLTSDAGLLLLREVDRRLGLTEAISDCLHDPRDPLDVVHEQQTMLAQRIFAIAAGYEDLNDQSRLVGERSPNRHCGTIRRCRQRPAKCQSRRSRSPRPPRSVRRARRQARRRLEQRVTRHALVAMSKLFVEIFLKSFDTPPEEIILDVDATDDPSRPMASRRNTAWSAGRTVRSRRRSA